MKTVKPTDDSYNRKEIWQTETRKLRRNTNTNSSQRMINLTNFYEALGTGEDASQTIDSPKQSQSANVLPTDNQTKARPNICITEKYINKKAAIKKRAVRAQVLLNKVRQCENIGRIWRDKFNC